MVRNRDDEAWRSIFQILKKIGVDAQVRLLEETAYHNRWQKHQFDMILVGWANDAIRARTILALGEQQEPTGGHRQPRGRGIAGDRRRA